MKRIIPGLALAAGWLFLLFKGFFALFAVVLLITTVLCSREFIRMASKPKIEPGWNYLLIFVFLLPFLGTVYFKDSSGVILGLIISFVFVTAFILYNYTNITDIFLFYSKAVFGTVYVGCLSSFLVLIYLLPEGNYWLVIMSAITAGADTGAYITGTLIGKHKLCPNVSPNKTIEGAIGGIVVASFLAISFGHYLLPGISSAQIIGISIIISIASIVGDLTESIVKRGTNTKDSGTMLGGHGGVLDRMDSMLFAAPILYYLLIYMNMV